MSGSVDEWITKAEGDHHTALRELNASEQPNYDAVCFHAQQCAEKLMKAVLIKRGESPPKIHDLRKLDRLLQASGVHLQESNEQLRLLSMSAVLSRYPGESADRETAKAVMEICDGLRSKLLALLSK